MSTISKDQYFRLLSILEEYENSGDLSKVKDNAELMLNTFYVEHYNAASPPMAKGYRLKNIAIDIIREKIIEPNLVKLNNENLIQWLLFLKEILNHAKADLELSFYASDYVAHASEQQVFSMKNGFFTSSLTLLSKVDTMQMSKEAHILHEEVFKQLFHQSFSKDKAIEGSRTLYTFLNHYFSKKFQGYSVLNSGEIKKTGNNMKIKQRILVEVIFERSKEEREMILSQTKVKDLENLHAYINEVNFLKVLEDEV